MDSFLQQIAKQLIENHNKNFENVCIILPNHRSIVYLKKYLSELIDKPTFAPKIWSIDDFVFEATHLQRCEKIDLLFELFAIHRTIAANNTRNFDDFIQWGDMILNDFDEIDANLIDADKIFSHLSEAKAIETWNIDNTPLTSREIDYLDFYNSLSTYYKLLREKVLTKNTAWTKLAFRVFCEKFDDFFRQYENKSFYIIGFNALTASEETLFNLIRKNANKTHLTWDYDNYYLQNQHEAGFFLHQNFKTFGKPEKSSAEEHHFFKQQKEIHVYDISKNYGQALETNRILNNYRNYNPDETLIILNDETLLMPILDFLPDSYTKFNVTMGYPLKNTQLYECIEIWLTLHTTASKNDNSFYYKELFKFIQHPVFQKYLHFINPSIQNELSEKILEYQKSCIPFLSRIDIQKKIFSKHQDTFQTIEKLFMPWDDSLQKANNGLMCLVNILRQTFEKEKDPLNLEYLFQISKIINRLQKITENFSDINTGIQSIKSIYRHLLNSISIPFSGEPLGGLQIMGLLESRLLDFKNVIMLSVNEGFIPSKSTLKTLIPFDIRHEFGLPTISEENAVFAYHFYRLLQRAENIHLLYNCADSNGVGSNEKSRYITQLSFELPKYCNDISIINHTESLPKILNNPLQTPVIKKDEQIMQRLKEIAAKGLSPSSINTFLDCSLKFYFSNILEISKPDEVMENLDSALLGQIVHKVFENLHKPLLNRLLKPEDIDVLLNDYDKEVKDCFDKMWQGGNYETGRNHLIYYVVKQWVFSFLKQEEEICKKDFFITEQEVELSYPLTFNVNNTSQSVKLKGFADRICSENNTTKIVDFKTGKVEESDTIIKDFDAFISGEYKEKAKHKALQLLVYAWLYAHQKNSQKPFEASIISLQKLSQNFFLKINGDAKITDEILGKIEQLLQKIVQDIFDRSIPFEATKDDKACRYCDFSDLCRWKNAKN